jgi:hypothetical protein
MAKRSSDQHPRRGRGRPEGVRSSKHNRLEVQMSQPGNTGSGSGGLSERAAELANKAAAAAGPLAAQAKERASELAQQAAPHVAQARQRAGKGVSGLAGRLSKISGGKYADKINSVSSKISEKLEDRSSTGGEPATGPTTTGSTIPPTTATTPPAGMSTPPPEPPPTGI